MPRYPEIHGLQRNLATSVDGVSGFGLGNLYNGHLIKYEINNEATYKFTPLDFRLPTIADYQTLLDYLETTQGFKLKSGNVADTPWLLGGYGNNSTVFSALPGGLRYSNGGFYLGRGSGFFWTCSEVLTNMGFLRLDFNSDNAYLNLISKVMGMSIRCIRLNIRWVNDKVGNIYGVIRIGNLEWLTSNLRTTEFGDGTIIPNNLYDNDADFGYADGAEYVDPMYGYVYNKAAVNYGTGYNGLAYITSKGSVETEWRIPTLNDFSYTRDILGGYATAGGHMKETGVDYDYWYPNNTSADNSSGFRALPAGKVSSNGYHLYYKTTALFWTSETATTLIKLLGDSAAFSVDTSQSGRDGYSVRLCRDYDHSTISCYDQEGYLYPCVEIGTQVWMAENLKTSHYLSGASIPNLQYPEDWISVNTPAMCAYNNDNLNV